MVHGLADLAANLATVQALIGTLDQPNSLASLLEARQQGAGRDLIEQAGIAVAAANALADRDLADVVVNDPEPAMALLEHIRMWRVTSATQMTGLLGVTIHFGDSDGD